jgi:hypothetical protein
LHGRVIGAGDQNERAPEALDCYERLGLRQNDRLSGSLQLVLEIATDGSVRSASVGASTLHAPAVERCLEQSALHWLVPSRGRVQYWLTFSKRD